MGLILTTQLTSQFRAYIDNMLWHDTDRQIACRKRVIHTNMHKELRNVAIELEKIVVAHIRKISEDK